MWCSKTHTKWQLKAARNSNLVTKTVDLLYLNFNLGFEMIKLDLPADVVLHHAGIPLVDIARKFTVHIIIVVIITWPGEKPSPNKNSDITVFRVSDLLKWLMFMQNFEHGVTVFNQLMHIICVLLFSVCCF